MVEVFETIKQVAPSRATVLIQGETGTGKELAATLLMPEHEPRRIYRRALQSLFTATA